MCSNTVSVCYSRVAAVWQLLVAREEPFYMRGDMLRAISSLLLLLLYFADSLSTPLTHINFRVPQINKIDTSFFINSIKIEIKNTVDF